MNDESPWKSSVLDGYESPDCCFVCAFVSGVRTTEVMEHVIRLLDGKLAETELAERELLRMVAKMKEQRES